MKHLRKFEADEFNLSEITKDINDMCLELKDEKLNVEVTSPGDTRIKTIVVKISATSFTFGQISEVYERIRDYTSTYGFKYYFQSRLFKGYGSGYGFYECTKDKKWGGLPKDADVLKKFILLLQKS